MVDSLQKFFVFIEISFSLPGLQFDFIPCVWFIVVNFTFHHSPKNTVAGVKVRADEPKDWTESFKIRRHCRINLGSNHDIFIRDQPEVSSKEELSNLQKIASPFLSTLLQFFFAEERTEIRAGITVGWSFWEESMPSMLRSEAQWWQQPLHLKSRNSHLWHSSSTSEMAYVMLWYLCPESDTFWLTKVFSLQNICKELRTIIYIVMFLLHFLQKQFHTSACTYTASY